MFNLGRCVLAGMCVLGCGLAAGAEEVPAVLMLPPSEANPRNSEGDFIRLKDGRVLFVYTHYTGGDEDEAAAYLAGRYSSDGGRTWTSDDVTILPNEGVFNVMSVSLLRLHDGSIGLFYLRKNAWNDCRLYLRRSTDEAQSWGEPMLCIPDEGYFVVNNDRVIQLESGRLVVPAACHTHYSSEFKSRGAAMCYLSDDNGRTWRRSRDIVESVPESASGMQEPGVVELKDKRLMMLCRTDRGCQMRAWSSDGGDTWSPPEETELRSPVSPASIERIPATGDLLIVWNDHSGIDPALAGKRTPLTVAISKDEGKTWERKRNIETAPDGWFCYTAIEFVDDHVLLAYCAGMRSAGNGLDTTKIALLPVSSL
jgi:sialidase-1